MLSSVENGFLASFKHQNGKTYRCEQIGDYEVDPRIAGALAGKSVEAQMGHYYVTESIRLYRTAYGEITKEALSNRAVALSEYSGVVRLLLKGDLLVGAVIKGFFGEGKLLPDRCMCTYLASDNEGSGTKDREDNAYLIYLENE